MKHIKIGIIGYSDISGLSEDDKEKYELGVVMGLRSAENLFRHRFGEDTTFELVGGLTDMGINKYAYEYASHKSKKSTYTKLVGFACSKASEYPCFPVDEKHIIGTEWGDESDAFLEYIDVLFKTGGRTQAEKEFKTFKERYPEKIAEESPPFHEKKKL